MYSFRALLILTILFSANIYLATAHAGVVRKDTNTYVHRSLRKLSIFATVLTAADALDQASSTKSSLGIKT
jgi:hypothetical protein